MKTLKLLAVPALLAAILAFATTGCQSDAHSTHSSAAAAKPYPLEKCVVSGEALGGTPYTFVHNGQEVKLCCKDCLADFNKDPDKYMAKIASAK